MKIQIFALIENDSQEYTNERLSILLTVLYTHNYMGSLCRPITQQSNTEIFGLSKCTLINLSIENVGYVH